MSPSVIGEWFRTFGRMGKRLFAISKPIGKGLLVLVIVLAVIHSIATFVLGRRLEAQIAAIKAKGEPVSMSDLGKPRVPDSQNAAVVYAKAFELIASPAAQKDLSTLGRFLSPREREDKPVSWEEAEFAVARLRPVMLLIEQAASRPKCQFPVNWEAGAAALCPHLAELKRLERFLLANAKLKARDGKMDEVVQSVDLAFKVGESVKDEPSLIAQIVRVAIIKKADHSLREALQYSDVEEIQAKQLHRTLMQIDLTPGFVKAMQGERAFGLWGFEYVGKHPKAFAKMMASGTGSGHLLWRLAGSYAWRPFLYADELLYLNAMNKSVDLASQPYRERQSKGLDQPVDFPKYAVISRIFFPVFARARARRDEGAAEVAGSRILLALHTYHHRFHSYPETLDELRAKLQWEIPADIFSGKDFVYKRQKKGFVLYSIGPDLKDDGGVPLGSTRDPVAKGDIVWKVER